jgi:N-acetylneuraminate synthase
MINIIAEAGISHNGDINIAKKMISLAAFAGCKYVKFQKRDPDISTPEHQKSVMKKTPWGEMTYLEYKKIIEFGYGEYLQLFEHARLNNVEMFASVWDKPSVDFMAQFTTIAKIPSAHLTNHDLCEYARNKFKTLMLSTGMSNEDEILISIKYCNPDIIFHTNSSYPSSVSELNLNYITHLKRIYPNKEIGYSGHEFGLATTFAAVALGATWIERHITLDRTMWGSDQLSSVEPTGLIKLVKGINDVEASLGKDIPREVYESELEKRKSLRG